MEIIRRGKDIILNPKLHQRTLIWMHGLGDSAEGFLPLFKINSILENCRFVLLTAPSRAVSLNYNEVMNSWYDIVSLEKREMNPEVTESAEIVWSEIRTQEKESENIFLGGFSQGGALSLYTGLAHLDKPVKGIIGLSCYAMDYRVKEQLKDTPVFLYHGNNDLIVTLKMAVKSYEERLAGVKYKFASEKGLGHGISLKALFEVKQWAKNYY